MTAQILQINCITGKYKILNMSHEPPIALRRQKDSASDANELSLDNYEFDIESLPAIASLGRESQLLCKVHEGNLSEGEKIVLVTDGIFAIKNEKKQLLSDRKLFNGIANLRDPLLSAKQFSDKLFEFLNNFRSNSSLDDDIAILVIERKLNLESNEGQNSA